MGNINDAWEQRRRNRWMRPNAHLYIRHDAWRFVPPGSPIYIGRDVVKYFVPDRVSGHSALGHTVSFTGPNGVRQTMRNGNWVK